MFTVVIPTYNSSTYISNALSSIENASESEVYEVLLVDDFSNDIHELICVANQYSNVRVIFKGKKGNAAESRNIGLINAKYEYIFFLDSDDRFVEAAIDGRINQHLKLSAGIVFGNFITSFAGVERHSNLPDYENCSMADYLFVLSGDFRSSTVSIYKKHYNGTSFDLDSNKHQDWIFAIKCYAKNERIYFDTNPTVVIYVDSNKRMSSVMNIKASKYFYDNYIIGSRQINGFSRRHWFSSISNRDIEACRFFFKIYKPGFGFNGLFKLFAMVIQIRPILYFSSVTVTFLRKLKWSCNTNNK